MDARRMLSTGLTVVAMTALSAACLIGPEPQALPSFALTNQSGAVIRAEQLHGRVAIISFMFTGCSEACPLVMSQLARAQADVLAAGLGSVCVSRPSPSIRSPTPRPSFDAMRRASALTRTAGTS
jgi:SCO1/SenC